jgi:hypothetical protein
MKKKKIIRNLKQENKILTKSLLEQLLENITLKKLLNSENKNF